MTELSPQMADAATATPVFRVVTQFLRDLSFENPKAPESLRAGGDQPQIDMGVEMNAKGREDGLFEVELKLSARAQRADEPVFVVEVVYAGLFQIEGLPESELEPVLLIEAPRFLFPFARRVIADATLEGGFPPFLLEPIDFAAVYMARKAQAEAPVAGNA